MHSTGNRQKRKRSDDGKTSPTFVNNKQEIANLKSEKDLQIADFKAIQMQETRMFSSRVLEAVVILVQILIMILEKAPTMKVVQRSNVLPNARRRRDESKDLLTRLPLYPQKLGLFHLRFCLL